MNENNMRALARLRYETAEAILRDAEVLLAQNSFISANNRAFYAAEKAVKAVLASAGKDSASHNGVIRVFNMEFVHAENTFFSHDDLKMLQGLERIRTASDYDDFYLASKDECKQQVENAKAIIAKAKEYLIANGII